MLSGQKMSGAPRDLTELSELTEDVKSSLVDALQRHSIGLQKRRRRVHHDPPTATQIRALRLLLGMSQTAFGHQLGASREGVAAWESNRRKPDRQFTFKLRRLAAINKWEIDSLSDPDYYDKQVRARVMLEPSRMVLERLEKAIQTEETGKGEASATATVQPIKR
jgi:DNA-binding transcriptional regulator YiaG